MASISASVFVDLGIGISMLNGTGGNGFRGNGLVALDLLSFCVGNNPGLRGSDLLTNGFDAEAFVKGFGAAWYFGGSGLVTNADFGVGCVNSFGACVADFMVIGFVAAGGKLVCLCATFLLPVDGVCLANNVFLGVTAGFSDANCLDVFNLPVDVEGFAAEGKIEFKSRPAAASTAEAIAS
jgi:hypothetical protein